MRKELRKMPALSLLLFRKLYARASVIRSRVYAHCVRSDLPFGQAAPCGLALDRPRPWQKRKIGRRKGEKEFFFSFWPQKEKSAVASEVKAGQRPPVGLGLDRISERRRYNYDWV